LPRQIAWHFSFILFGGKQSFANPFSFAGVTSRGKRSAAALKGSSRRKLSV
jgi:hypothetical protein